MKAETVIIADQEHLHDLFKARELPLGTSLQKICILLANEAYGEKIPCLYLKLGLGFVPNSYHAVPAMFAKLMEGRIEYRYIQAYKEEDKFLILRCANKRRLATFKARVLKACTEGEFYKVKKKNVPKSYRYRPGVIAKMLTEELCRPFAYIANEDSITWKEKELTDDE